MKDMTSFGTDFKMYAYGQGYSKVHLTSASAVMHLFGDGDPDADYLMLKASAMKEFTQTEKPLGNGEPSQAQEGQLGDTTESIKLYKPQLEAKAAAKGACKVFVYWDRIRSKKRFKDPMGLSRDKQQSILVHGFGTSMRISSLSYT
jgi:hypothetical protein